MHAPHLPPSDGGVHVTDSLEDRARAIAGLEALRVKEAPFLFVPQQGLLRFEQCRPLRDHVATHYPLMSRDPDIGLLYDMRFPVSQATVSRACDAYYAQRSSWITANIGAVVTPANKEPLRAQLLSNVHAHPWQARVDEQHLANPGLTHGSRNQSEGWVAVGRQE